jgi:peptidoglycan hydrolase-like protein with peptidoglycan-binding domain
VILLVALLFNVLMMLLSDSKKNVVPAVVSNVQFPPPAPQAIAPAQGHALSREEVRELQRILKQLGFKPGQADGLIGPQTRSAARAFAQQFVPGGPGDVDASLLEKARAVSR